ncbi:MAG: hypothetical protein ACKVON_16315 [Beijerinckiaceae bacterium]
MKFAVLVAAMIIGLAGSALAGPYLTPLMQLNPAQATELAQFNAGEGRGFRRCMRAKYGPRYFSGVRPATRFFMAQTCGV